MIVAGAATTPVGQAPGQGPVGAVGKRRAAAWRLSFSFVLGGAGFVHQQQQPMQQQQQQQPMQMQQQPVMGQAPGQPPIGAVGSGMSWKKTHTRTYQFWFICTCVFKT